MRPRRCWQSVGALAIYLAASVVFFGLPILGRLSRAYLGHGADPTSFMWCLVWWPHAILRGLNPFHTDAIWAPVGFNLARGTCVPGASLLALPITLTLGPVIAYNVLSLFAPTLSAWTAYLLCRHVTKAFWPSLAGGYVFGFSTYELGHMGGHLNLTLVFIVPLAVYLVLLRLDDLISPRAFVLLLALALTFQFLFSSEVFATMTVFGLMVLLLASLIMPADIKRPLRSTCVPVLCAYAVTVLAVSPYLYALFFAEGLPRDLPGDTNHFVSDLLNFVIPTPITLLGHHQFSALTSRFAGNEAENGTYIGVPLLVIVFLLARTRWRTASGRLLLLSLCLIGLASLGGKLHIAGITTVSLPWRLVRYLPLIKHALPVRFMMYASLILALIVAAWLRTSETRRWVKGGLLFLAVLFLLPNLAYSSFWSTPLSPPEFFTAALYTGYLAPGGNTLVIPYSARGPSMLWQAQTGMYFRMAGGATPGIPNEFKRWAILHTFYCGTLIPDYGTQLQAFLAAHNITTVIVAEGSQGPWQPLFATLEVQPVNVGGVTLYRVPARVAALKSDKKSWPPPPASRVERCEAA